MKLLKYIIFSIVLIYFQVLILSRINILGSNLYILLALVTYLSINLNYVSSMTMTLIISLIWDIMYPELLGLNIIINVLICYVVYIFHQNINKEKLVSVFFSVFLINLFYFAGYWLYYMISYQNTQIIVISSVLNLLLNTVFNVLILYLLVLTDKIVISIDHSNS